MQQTFLSGSPLGHCVQKRSHSRHFWSFFSTPSAIWQPWRRALCAQTCHAPQVERREHFCASRPTSYGCRLRPCGPKCAFSASFWQPYCYGNPENSRRNLSKDAPSPRPHLHAKFRSDRSDGAADSLLRRKSQIVHYNKLG